MLQQINQATRPIRPFADGCINLVDDIQIDLESIHTLAYIKPKYKIHLEQISQVCTVTFPAVDGRTIGEHDWSQPYRSSKTIIQRKHSPHFHFQVIKHSQTYFKTKLCSSVMFGDDFYLVWIDILTLNLKKEGEPFWNTEVVAVVDQGEIWCTGCKYV